MLSFFLTQTISHNPLLILPGLYGSTLYATTNNTGLPFYCSQKYNDKLIWVNLGTVLSPFINCFLYSITNKVDDNGYPNNTFELKPHDFGGNESVLDIIHIPGITKFYGMFTKLLNFLQDRDYEVKRDLYSVPYDFRNVPLFPGHFFDDLINLIEKAYSKEGKKVDLFGFSQGCFVLQQFLTEHTTEEWRSKYVNQVVFLAPSFTGSTSIFYEFWTKKFAFAPFLHMKQVREFMESWSGFHIHVPNTKVFENETIVFGPNGEEYKPKDLFDLMVEQKVIKGNNIKMFKHAWDRLITKYPKEIDPKIPVTIFYNDGVKTRFRYRFSKGWNKDPEIIYGEGDGTISSVGLKNICSTWKNVKCHRIHGETDDYSHDGLINNEFVFQQIYNILNGKEVVTEIPQNKQTANKKEL